MMDHPDKDDWQTTRSEQAKRYQMEYYNGFPNISIRFEVTAHSWDEAVRKGDQAVAELRRTACYTV